MNEMIKPVIVAVAYDRAESLRRLLFSIGKAEYKEKDIRLIISIDYKNNNNDVIEVAEKFIWKYGEKKIVTHSSNLGLRRHILECGNYAIQYGAAIILEDDLLVAPDFYTYAKAAQNFYKEEERIAGVALYSHEWNEYARKRFTPIADGNDVYFAQYSITWGQCWTSKQWKGFVEWYERNENLERKDNIPISIYNWSENSWGKYFVYYIIEKNKYYVVPYIALSTCFSEVGVHTKNITLDNQVRLQLGEKEYKFTKFEEGLHYDIFFENKDLPHYLTQYTKGDSSICINLYGLKSKNLERNYKYVLTTQKRYGNLIQSFARQMRPIEMNVIYELLGDEIYLYECNTSDKEMNNYNLFREINYEAQGMPWQNALYYGIIRAIYGIRMIIAIWVKAKKKTR